MLRLSPVGTVMCFGVPLLLCQSRNLLRNLMDAVNDLVFIEGEYVDRFVRLLRNKSEHVDAIRLVRIEVAVIWLLNTRNHQIGVYCIQRHYFLHVLPKPNSPILKLCFWLHAANYDAILTVFIRHK